MNSVFGADDYEFIRNRIKEINQEKEPPPTVADTRPTCEACKDAGGCNGMCMHCYGDMT